jgi:hypothetical protein
MHPLATPSAGQQPGRVDHALVDRKSPALIKASLQLPAPTLKSEACVLKAGSPEGPKPKEESLVASGQ